MKTTVFFVNLMLLCTVFVQGQSNTQKTKLKFIEFSFSDSQSYVFQNEQEAYFDFSQCKVKEQFSKELSADEANDENQGWGSNTSLQGKWFMISWTEAEAELYEGGPKEKIKVITKIEAL